jgi:hypothetical protein
MVRTIVRFSFVLAGLGSVYAGGFAGGFHGGRDEVEITVLLLGTMDSSSLDASYDCLYVTVLIEGTTIVGRARRLMGVWVSGDGVAFTQTGGIRD